MFFCALFFCYISFFFISMLILFYCVILFFFFKQKTAYEMRISDWSSDVCSSDLLPGSFLSAMESGYQGTRLGRQELDGELIEELEGALWNRDLLERRRVRTAPAVKRMVVGVDPPASAHGDACGIVAVALCGDGRAYLVADASVSGRSPEGWARAVAEAASVHGADRVVAEANNGGAMVESVLRAADMRLPVRLVHASRGKSARAEPVAALYESGRALHCGAFPELEDEMCGLLAGGGSEGPGRSAGGGGGGGVWGGGGGW